MIAITGLIGAGKSLVAKLVREAGFEALDADLLAHKIYAENSSVREKISNIFGEAALCEQGINRQYISQIVFNDEQKLKLLENIIYPEMQKEIAKINPPFLEAAVLNKWLECGLSAEIKIDGIWIVEADEGIRKKRLLERGLSERDIEKRMKAQVRNDEKWTNGIPIVRIENNGTIEELKNAVLENFIQKNIPLKEHCSFKIGGNAKFFAEPKTVVAIKNLLAWSKKLKIPFFILGCGSNALFSDEGFDGLVIKLPAAIANQSVEYIQHSNAKLIADSALQFKVSAGCKLHSLIQNAAKQNLSGLEKLDGIPASVGGAIFMNAGAHGQQISDCIVSAQSINVNGELKNRSKEECEFSYRNSIFKKLAEHSGGLEKEIVISAEFKFTPMPKENIDKNRKDVLKWRKEKQPLNFPNAGSIFKNPAAPSPLPAAALIDKCGLKGLRIGDAQVSELHANFIVNLGNAKAKDVKLLIEIIKNKVREKFNIELEEEIVYV